MGALLQAKSPGGDGLVRVPRLRAGSPRHSGLRHRMCIAVASRAGRHVAARHPRDRRRPSTKRARQESRRPLDHPAAIEAPVIRPGQRRARPARPAAHQDADRTRRQRAADAAPVARRSGHGLVRRRHAQRDHGVHDGIFAAGHRGDRPNSRRFACMLAAPHAPGASVPCFWQGRPLDLPLPVEGESTAQEQFFHDPAQRVPTRP